MNAPKGCAPATVPWRSRLMLRALKSLAHWPLPWVRRLGWMLGGLAWYVAAPRRHVTLVNLRLCFPDWSEDQRRAVGKEHFRWFMASIFERFIFWFGPAPRIATWVRLENESIMQAHQGRPLIILAPHFVALDAGGMRLAMSSGYVTMYQRQKDPILDAAIRAGRERFGAALVLSRQQGLRQALAHIRAGVPFYYLPDMDLGSRDAVFVPFFGVPAATVTATARLVKLTGAAVVPFVSRMTPQGYVGRFYPPWDDFPGDDLVAATRRLNAFIEDRVREMPAQYLWSHKRFKTRPGAEPNPYRT